MASTASILTSIHGKLVGLSATKKLVAFGRQLVGTTDEGTLIIKQGAHSALNATGALTAALIKNGIVLSSTAAAVAGTLPTGAVLDATFTGDDALRIGEAFEWSVINTGPNSFTVTAAASGHTVAGAGNMVVATVTSGYFLTRKTAADTFVTYRMA